MSLELLGRIQQELSITGSAIYETVLALAERTNRKVQVLRLHSQASTLLSQIEQTHGELGLRLSSAGEGWGEGCHRRHGLADSAHVPQGQAGSSREPTLN